eukprot:gene34803-42147_t
MLDEKMEPDIAKNMIYGASDPLYSSYHISYNMVLNMMRVEGADPEKLIKCSFHQFQQELNAPGLLRKAAEIEEKARDMHIPDEELAIQYTNLLGLQKELRLKYRNLIMEPARVLPFLSTGRMVKVSFADREWGWAVVLGVKRAVEKKPMDSTFDAAKYIGRLSSRRLPLDGDHFVDILMEVARKPVINPTDTENHLAISPLIPGEHYDKASKEILLVHASLEALCEVSAVKLNVPKDFKATSGTRNAVWGAHQEVLRRFSPPKGDGVPLMDPIRDMEVPAAQIQPIQERMRELGKRLEESQFRHVSKEALAALADKKALLEEAAQYKKEATELQSVTMKEELKKMRKVLKRMDYVNAEGVLSAKGRFACELTAGDELVLCNMVFGGMFNELTVEQTVAILSCLVHKEPSQDSSSSSTPKIRADMQKPFRQLQAVAKEVAKVCVEVRLFAEEQEFVDGFVPTLVDVAYAWASGSKFSEVCKLTDVFEGSIIRSLRRLEELLRQLAVASQAIGNNELVALFNEGATKIRRGVVFAASLYI